MTKAQLMRDAHSGILKLELLPEGTWASGIPDRIKGIRKVIGANTVSLFLERADGNGSSTLDLGPACLVEYEKDHLKIYKPGHRKPTAEEQAILDEWAAVTQTEKYQKDLEYDLMTDCSLTYWQKIAFFEKRNALYLTGYRDRQHGAKLDVNVHDSEERISDKNVRGDLSLSYRVYRTEECA